MMQTCSHSGAVPVGGAIGMVLAGAAAAGIGGIVYAYAFYWIPFVYVNFLITLSYAAVIGFVIAFMVFRGKVRNNSFVRVAAWLVALLGLYVYWAAYLWALAGIGNVGLQAFWPPTLAGFAKHLFTNGSWGVKDFTVTGWPLVAVWLIEAGTVLWIATSVALAHAHLPFCESCDQWTDVETDMAHLAATGEEPAWQKVFAGDLPSLAEFSPAHQEAAQFVRLDVARCPKCELSRFLTVSTVQITIDKKGNSKVQERPLVTNLIVTPGQFAVVEACSQLYRDQLQAEATAALPAEDQSDEPQPTTSTNSSVPDTK